MQTPIVPAYLARERSRAEFLTAESVPTVVVSAIDHPMNEMSSLFDATFRDLFPLLAEHGIHPVGPAFSLHHRMPTDTADLEVGVPVDHAPAAPLVTSTGTVLQPSTIPGGEIAVVSHVGSYDRLGDAWGAFMEAVAKSGRRPDVPFWEFYVTEPTPDADPETMRTDLCVLTRP